VKQLRAPQESLGDLDAEAAAHLVATASDIVLVLNADGVIQDLACSDDSLVPGGPDAWMGRRWIETVTIESRTKVEALLHEAAAGASARWRQVNHPSRGGADIPVLYSALGVGETGSIVAIGRDLRAMAAMQQSLLQAQQSMERDYSRLRHVEGRYRLLFKMSSDAILILDSGTLRVMEFNPAAERLLRSDGGRLAGEPLLSYFDDESAGAIESLLGRLQATGHVDEVPVRIRHSRRELQASASLFRQDNASLFLLRLSVQPHDEPAAALSNSVSNVMKVVEHTTDGFVVTDADGQIVTANPAFVDLAQLATEEQARGEPLERWLGRSSVDMSVLLNNLRQSGSIRLFSTMLRGEHGSSADVEVSAVSVSNRGQRFFGFTIRDIGRRLPALVGAGREPSRTVMPRSIEQLTELVGRVPLKELVRESTDVIERMCIEAALALTGDNRASAAELLGLSRQSLYLKLRRYGLGDLVDETDKSSERQPP
jgi:transcriptional regulator PpsR